MSAVRPTAPGATRNCPHCKATVLASASICPACQHHLRFNAVGAAAAAPAGYAALQVEGTVRHKQLDEPCEFCVVLSIANERANRSRARWLASDCCNRPRPGASAFRSTWCRRPAPAP